MDFILSQLGSVTGIVGLTVAIVALLKRLFANVGGFNAVPTWIYSVVVAFLLAVFASAVLHTLPGVWYQVAWQAVIAAASASGAYEWFKSENIQKPLAMSAKAAGVRVKPSNMPKGY